MAIQVLSGYKLEEVLGQGPHATVYKSKATASQSWVAVKVLDTTAGIENVESLLRLNHRHIAAIFEINLRGEQPFAVTEYLSGGTLKEHIRSLSSVGDFLPFEQIVDYAGQIAAALKHAHGEGIAHGNLKPENLMFDAAGVLKLVDFAAAADTRSDVYSFGKVLYEMLTGRAPIPAVPGARIESVRSDIPAGFDQVVRRLMDSESGDQYSDFDGVLADLSMFSTSQLLTQVRTSPAPAAAVVAAIAAASPNLTAGRVLAGRFKIVRFIARGGMGDVYEAEDLELQELVALKTVRPEIASNIIAMERFKREIQLSRKVTHPNVCRVFDIFHDAAASASVTFLTMELIQGETLQQRVIRCGRISTGEALPIVRQMAAGLDAAHRAGIIHRDFKTSNVMLALSAAKTDGPIRAVITDFGLARPAPEQRAMATLSQPGDTLGTPAYMAPEQLENGEITAATDVYALGIVLYEMVTGALPFDGETAYVAALKRLQGPPPSPRTHVPDLDCAWEATILKCLERGPADRFGSTEEVIKALDGQAIVEPVRGQRRHAQIGRRHSVFIAGMIAALALLAVVLLMRSRLTPSEFKARRSVAVLGFRNQTGQPDAAWLSAALADMLTTELGAGEKLRTVASENVERMFARIPLPESGSFAPDTLTSVRNYLGADVVVYGSYVVLNGNPQKIRMDLRLQDSVQGSLIAAISEEGYVADLLTLVSRGGAALREKMGLAKLEPKEAELVRAALPATPEAAHFYAEGLEKLRGFDGMGARTALEKAIAEDGRHAVARAALATAWSMLGYATKAREQARIALDLSAKLGREDQLLVQGRAREAALEWRQAVDAYQTLFGFFPDNLDYGLRLANAQTSAGEAKDSLITIEKLRKFPQPQSDSPGIDVAEARAAAALSDFKRQLAMASRAAAKGNERGAKPLVAGAKLVEGNAFASLGELAPARGAFEEAKRLYTELGDRWDEANASTNLATVIMRSGDLRQADAIYQESLATYRQLGDRRGEAAALTSIGTLLRNRGDFSKAKDLHLQALDIRREVGDRAGEATSRNNVANILSLMGDSQTARKMYQEALPVFREIGDRNAVATVLSNLGDLVSEEGDLPRARELYEESRAVFQELGNKSSLAQELSRLGELDLIDGDLGSARKRHEQALALRKEMTENASVGESQLALAQIALHEGEAAAAESAAKQAAEGFAAANRPDDEASATAVLARSLLSQEKYNESLQAIQRAEQLSGKSDDIGIRLSVAITAASIRAAGGDVAKSLKDLDAVIKEARKARLIQLELEARLAVAEVDIAASRFREGRLVLDELETEASQRGYKFIAARASAARKRIPGYTAA